MKSTQRMQLFSVTAVVIVLVGVMVLVMTTHKQSQDVRGKAALSGPTLTLVPATESGLVGTTFPLDLSMSTHGDTISAAEFHLTYDPQAVQILSFAPGKPLSVVLKSETHANGVITVVLGAPLTTPFNGDGLIGVWQVKILKVKQSTIAIADTTKVASIKKTANSLAAVTNTVVSGVSSLTSPTPTPSPTPSGTGDGATPTPAPTDNATPIPTQTSDTSTNQTSQPTVGNDSGSFPTTTPISKNQQQRNTTTTSTSNSLSWDTSSEEVSHAPGGVAETPSHTLTVQSLKTSTPQSVFEKFFIAIEHFFQQIFHLQS